MDYVFSLGSDDPRGFTADNDAAAVRLAVDFLRTHAGDDLRRRPDAVLTLMGRNGLVTRPSERLDEFVARAGGATSEADALQPGDTNAPDCNGD